MLSVLKILNNNLKFGGNKLYKIDNLAFRFHYRLTTNLLLVLMVIVTSQELIGEHIKCLVSIPRQQKVINTFCYMKSTFSVAKYMVNNQTQNIYPGIGPSTHRDVIKRQAYYQWVPFFLFLQAMAFYVPHYIWKSKEGGTMKKLIEGLEFAAFAGEKSISIGNSNRTPTRNEIDEKFAFLKSAFKDHLVVNRNWTHWLVTCEFLNFLNLMWQIWLTNAFLDQEFYFLGLNFINTFKSEAHILHQIFPKITKCTFNKFGASGTIQKHDALCLMPLNIINEKIFLLLWFWYILLLIISVSALIYRGMTWMYYSKSLKLNKLIFLDNYSAGKQLWAIMNITKNSCYMDWLFLIYLAKNMDGLVFRSFMDNLIEDFCPKDACQKIKKSNVISMNKVFDDSLDKGVTNEIYPDLSNFSI